MPNIKYRCLTESTVKQARCPRSKTSIDLRDGNGLILRISKKGVKYWRYEYRDNTQKKTLSLGKYPETTLKAARALCLDARELRDMGIDPVEQAKQEAFEAKRERNAAFAQKLPEPSFVELVDEYVATLAGSPSSYEVKRTLYKNAVTNWQDRKGNSISRRECVLLLDEVKKRAPVQANRLYAYLKRLFRVGVQRGLIDINPMNDVAKPAPKAEYRNNAHKALNHNQISQLISTLGDNEFDDVIRLMFLTGARPKEILNMKWGQIHDDVWVLGLGEHKASYRKAQILSRPLTKTAQEIIKKHQGTHNELVFPGPNGKTMNTSSLDHFIGRKRNHYGVIGFTPHHIRHTMSTRMREIGIRPDIVERILGHIVDVGSAGVYNSYDFLVEMREALGIWESWLVKLVGQDDFLLRDAPDRQLQIR